MKKTLKLSLLFIFIIVFATFFVVFGFYAHDNKANISNWVNGQSGVNISSIVELQTRIGELTNDIEIKEFQLKSMSQKLSEAEDEIALQNTALNNLTNEISVKNDTINTLELEKNQLQAEYDELSQSVEEYEDRLSQIEQRLNEITAELSSLYSDLEGLKNTSQSIQSRLSELDEILNDQSEQIEIIESEILSINSDIASIQHEIELLKSGMLVGDWVFYDSRTGFGDIDLSSLSDYREIMIVAEISGVESLTQNVTMTIPKQHISTQDRTFAMGMYFGSNNYIGVYVQIASNRLFLNNVSVNGAVCLDNTTIYVYYR